MKMAASAMILLAVALSPACWANSTPVRVHGTDASIVVPVRNSHIRMVRETVKVDCAWTTYTVQADFWFKNTSNEAQTLEFGFPVDYYVHAGEEAIRDVLDSFSVQWNSKALRPRLAKLQQEVREGGPVFYRQWIYWTAHFAPQEEASSQVRYGADTSWYLSSGGQGVGDTGYCFFKYILKTGAAWGGPIESSVVEIHYGHSIPEFFGHYLSQYDPEPNVSDLSIYPSGYEVDTATRTIRWKMTDFIPDKDIYFGWGDVPDFKKLDHDRPAVFEEIPGNPDELTQVP